MVWICPEEEFGMDEYKVTVVGGARQEGESKTKEETCGGRKRGHEAGCGTKTEDRLGHNNNRSQIIHNLDKL